MSEVWLILLFDNRRADISQIIEIPVGLVGLFVLFILGFFFQLCIG